MKIIETVLKGVLIIEPQQFKDERGYFFESYQKERYREIAPDFVQDNFSHSKKNVIRGLHFQKEHPQGKLVYVTKGSVCDVVVDIRQGSPTFGKYITVELNDQNHKQVFIPPGLAHGFCVLSETVDFVYKCTDYYYPKSEYGICWNDPTIGISWPITHPVLSEKDKMLPQLQNISVDTLPVYDS